jgi:branched-chain amino acid transport system permease protein
MSQFAQLLISGILAGGLYGIISVGLTLIFGVLNMVNFAHGEFLMLSMYVTFWSAQLLHLDPYIALPLVVLVMFGLSLLIQLTAIRPIVEAPHEVQIVVTLGLSMMLQNAALMAWGGNLRVLKTSLSEKVLDLGGLYVSVPRLVTFLVAVVATALLYLYVRRSYFGKAIRATAQDARAARLVGINVPFVYMMTYGIGIALVGVAGATLMPLYPVYPTIGWHFVNIAFIAVVLGGLGSIPGAMVGGIIIGVIESLAGYYLGPEFQQAAYFVVFIVLLIIRPLGLFKR